MPRSLRGLAVSTGQNIRKTKRTLSFDLRERKTGPDDLCHFTSLVDIEIQFNLLTELFPEFPSLMMKTLFVRENGNSNKVAKFLRKRGWSAKDITLTNQLSSQDCLCYTTSYYWGPWEAKFDEILRSKSKRNPGSFYTCLIGNDLFVKYLNENGELADRRILCPRISAVEQQLANLKVSLPRPGSISSFHLVPLQCP